jgi:hypothetical protein
MTFGNGSGGVLIRAALVFTLCASALGPALATPTPQQQRATRAARQRPAKTARQAPAPQSTGLKSQWRAALDAVSAESMRGNLSFISSDLLEGRKTPSRGLDIAAEYIAAQFRRAGLEPAGDDGYFQTANWKLTGRDMSSLQMNLNSGGSAVPLSADQLSLGFGVSGFSFWTPDADLSLKDAGVLKVAYKDAPALTREQAAGKVVLTELPEFPRADRARAFQLLREENDFLARLHTLGAPLVVALDRAGGARGASAPRIVDPEAGARQSPLGKEPTTPLVTVHGADAARLFDSLPAGATTATLNFRAPALVETPVKVRNVAGILRGSDPALKDTYVIVSAHYDHLGVKPEGEPGDRIYNGANDDGSGTVGVIELASALSRLNPRPRRSILFLTFFGEELGLFGSRFYGRHPVVPLEKTVAQVNLEQIGRTDDSEGPQVGTAAVTGFDFSDVGTILQQAGVSVGVKIYKHPTNSDAYFGRSDNQSLADAGIPAHTLSVAFEFPDYHAVGDEWPKIDFANMEKVVRTVALGALMIADNPQEPRWNEANPKTAEYVQAWKKLHGK